MLPLLLLILPLVFGAFVRRADNTSNTTAPAPPPTVTATIWPSTGDGSAVHITGVTQNGLDSFLGIPYAQPPIGDLRFAHPQPKVYSANVSATTPPPACLQYTNYDLGKQLAGSFGTSEDCLTINVMTPHGVAGTDAGLPVMVWVYGGGFFGGAATQYLSPAMVGYGAQTDRPFILVTFNFRLGIFGWGYGKQMADNGAANLGQRDIILAFEWVKQNIAAFGGDPCKVTAAGQATGAMSISLLMLNQSMDLFRGAIMQSGAPSMIPVGPTDQLWQAQYDAIVAAAGCNASTTGKDTTFACLKALDGDKLTNASFAIKLARPLAGMWAPSIDGDLIPDHPHSLVAKGSIARIPFITGNTRDEATVIIEPTINASTGISTQLASWSPFPINNSVLGEILEQYPNNPALGCPFETGNQTFGLDPIFKQATAIFTDFSWMAPRRFFLRSANKYGLDKTWTYVFQGPTPGLPPFLGFPHALDNYYVFGYVSPAGNYTADDVALSQAMMNYWINFVHFLDPNGENIPHPSSKRWINPPGGVNATYWRPHQFPANKHSIVLAPRNVSAIEDNFREQRMAVFNRPDVVKALWY